MQDALAGEMIRRQELLRAAGNYALAARLRAGPRRRAPTWSRCPSLFIVVDEFSELLSAKPDFIDLFVTIGRLGRSLGVHLLLASQRLEEGRLRGLETHLSYRIGLRTFSAMRESRACSACPTPTSCPARPASATSRSTTDDAGAVQGRLRLRRRTAAAARPAGAGRARRGARCCPSPAELPVEPRRLATGRSRRRDRRRRAAGRAGETDARRRSSSGCEGAGTPARTGVAAAAGRAAGARRAAAAAASTTERGLRPDGWDRAPSLRRADRARRPALRAAPRPATGTHPCASSALRRRRAARRAASPPCCAR